MEPGDRVIIPEKEFSEKESKYNAATNDNSMTNDIAFQYAWCLINSKYPIEINKGIHILNGLCKSTTDRRDYMYYLAVGYSNVKEYKKALEILDIMLESEPTNMQVASLREKIQKLSQKNTQENAIIAGGIALTAAGMLMAGFALAKK